MKTKFTLYKIFIIVVLAVLTSCHTTTKLSITGTPGSEIYQTDGKQLGTIPYSGQLKLDLDDKAYNAFLISRNPSTNEIIPFALDYKYKGRGSTQFAKGAGYTLLGIGTATALTGFIVAICSRNDDEMSRMGGIIAATGAGLGAISAGFGATADTKMDQANYKYSFQYMPDQCTNENIGFTTPDINYISQTKPVASSTSDTRLRPSNSTSNNKISDENKTSKPTRSVGDIAKKVQGDYVGYGSISLNDEVLEQLNGVTIQIKKVSSGVVEVSIIESDGNDFFGIPLQYNIEKDKDSSKYILKGVNNSSMIITIDNNENLTYINPAVEIEGVIYILAIDAKKQ